MFKIFVICLLISAELGDCRGGRGGSRGGRRGRGGGVSVRRISSRGRVPHLTLPLAQLKVYKLPTSYRGVPKSAAGTKKMYSDGDASKGHRETDKSEPGSPGYRRAIAKSYSELENPRGGIIGISNGERSGKMGKNEGRVDSQKHRPLGYIRTGLQGYKARGNGSYSYEGYNNGVFQGIKQIPEGIYKPKSNRFGFGNALTTTATGLLVWNLIRGPISTQYNVYNFYNKDEEAPSYVYIHPDIIVDCNGNATTLCPPNTLPCCISDETIFCMASIAKTNVCDNKVNGRCVSCDNCENMPCIANGMIFRDDNVYCVTTVAVPLDSNLDKV